MPIITDPEELKKAEELLNAPMPEETTLPGGISSDKQEIYTQPDKSVGPIERLRLQSEAQTGVETTGWGVAGRMLGDLFFMGDTRKVAQKNALSDIIKGSVEEYAPMQASPTPMGFPSEPTARQKVTVDLSKNAPALEKMISDSGLDLASIRKQAKENAAFYNNRGEQKDYVSSLYDVASMAAEDEMAKRVHVSARASRALPGGEGGNKAGFGYSVVGGGLQNLPYMGQFVVGSMAAGPVGLVLPLLSSYNCRYEENRQGDFRLNKATGGVDTIKEGLSATEAVTPSTIGAIGETAIETIGGKVTDKAVKWLGGRILKATGADKYVENLPFVRSLMKSFDDVAKVTQVQEYPSEIAEEYYQELWDAGFGTTKEYQQEGGLGQRLLAANRNFGDNFSEIALSMLLMQGGQVAIAAPKAISEVTKERNAENNAASILKSLPGVDAAQADAILADKDARGVLDYITSLSPEEAQTVAKRMSARSVQAAEEIKKTTEWMDALGPKGIDSRFVAPTPEAFSPLQNNTSVYVDPNTNIRITRDSATGELEVMNLDTGRTAYVSGGMAEGERMQRATAIANAFDRESQGRDIVNTKKREMLSKLLETKGVGGRYVIVDSEDILNRQKDLSEKAKSAIKFAKEENGKIPQAFVDDGVREKKDADGNVIKDENGNPVLEPPTTYFVLDNIRMGSGQGAIGKTLRNIVDAATHEPFHRSRYANAETSKIFNDMYDKSTEDLRMAVIRQGIELTNGKDKVSDTLKSLAASADDTVTDADYKDKELRRYFEEGVAYGIEGSVTPQSTGFQKTMNRLRELFRGDIGNVENLRVMAEQAMGKAKGKVTIENGIPVVSGVNADEQAQEAKQQGVEIVIPQQQEQASVVSGAQTDNGTVAGETAATPALTPEEVQIAAMQEPTAEPPPVAEGVNPSPESGQYTAGVPTMITRKMEADLKTKGYTQVDIDGMTPQQAWDAINAHVSPVQSEPQKPIVQPEAEKVNQGAKPVQKEAESVQEKPESVQQPAEVSPKKETRPQAVKRIKTAFETKSPVSVADIDKYGIRVPDTYGLKSGEYVYTPTEISQQVQPTTTSTAKKTPYDKSILEPVMSGTRDEFMVAQKEWRRQADAGEITTAELGRRMVEFKVKESPKAEPIKKAKVSGLAGILDDFDNSENGIETVRNLADAVEQMEHPPKDAIIAVANYRASAKEDFTSLGSRGDVEEYESKLVSDLRSITKQPKESTNATQEGKQPEDNQQQRKQVNARGARAEAGGRDHSVQSGQGLQEEQVDRKGRTPAQLARLREIAKQAREATAVEPMLPKKEEKKPEAQMSTEEFEAAYAEYDKTNKKQRESEYAVSEKQVFDALAEYDKNKNNNIIETKANGGKVYYTISSSGKRKVTYSVTENGAPQYGFYRTPKFISNASREDVHKFITERMKLFANSGFYELGGEWGQLHFIFGAIEDKKPVNAAVADKHNASIKGTAAEELENIDLTGYVREGDLYVFKPTPPTPPSPKKPLTPPSPEPEAQTQRKLKPVPDVSARDGGSTKGKNVRPEKISTAPIDLEYPERLSPAVYKGLMSSRVDKMTGEPFAPTWVTYDDVSGTYGAWSRFLERRKALVGKRTAKEVLDTADSDRGTLGSEHAWAIEGALKEKAAVNAEAVDVYDIPLPEGYVREGDFYVYKPTPPSGGGGKKPSPASRIPKGAKVVTTYDDKGTSFSGEFVRDNGDGTVTFRAFGSRLRKGLFRRFGVDEKGAQITKEMTVPSETVKATEPMADLNRMTPAQREALRLMSAAQDARMEREIAVGESAQADELTRRTMAEERRQAQREEGTRFRIVTDENLKKKLETGEKIKVYRAMQMIDGNLYPPMSAKVEGVLRNPTEIGVWEQADEQPELVKNGKFVLVKGNKASVPARYNPYFHTSRSPLNDQFSSASNRPNLVTVEVEIPASELSSGYKAVGAKDAVGEMSWHSGPVSSKLAKQGLSRKVILSRYAKVIRIVPDNEVADKIASMLKGRGISIPNNVITPSLKSELLKRGVQVSGEEGTRFRKDQIETPAFKTWFGDSKVVDADGKPLVVYHGTRSDFTVFDATRLGSNSGNPTAGWGFQFASNPQYASGMALSYGGGENATLMPVFLALQNPKRLSYREFKKFQDLGNPPWDGKLEALAQEAQDFKEQLLVEGYDGIIVEAGGLPGSLTDQREYVAFYPTQIKSATANVGTFDPANPDIRFSMAKDEYDAAEMQLDIYREEQYNVLNEFFSGKHARQPWDVVPFGRVKKIWEDFIRNGFVRDVKGVEAIADRMIRNVARLQVNTEFMGHERGNAVDYIEDDNMRDKWDDVAEERFVDYVVSEEGAWRISDSVIRPLNQDSFDLLLAETPEDMLQIIDRMFNRVHPRSDIASLFVEGGSRALSQLSASPSDGIRFSMDKGTEERMPKARETFKKFESFMDNDPTNFRRPANVPQTPIVQPQVLDKAQLRQIIDAISGGDAPALTPSRVNYDVMIQEIQSRYNESEIRHLVTQIANDRRDWHVDDETLFKMRIFLTKRENDVASYAEQMYAAERNGDSTRINQISEDTEWAEADAKDAAIALEKSGSKRGSALRVLQRGMDKNYNVVYRVRQFRKTTGRSVSTEDFRKIREQAAKDAAEQKKNYDELRKALAEEEKKRFEDAIAKAKKAFDAQVEQAYRKGARDERDSFEYLLNDPDAEPIRRIDPAAGFEGIDIGGVAFRVEDSARESKAASYPGALRDLARKIFTEVQAEGGGVVVFGRRMLEQGRAKGFKGDMIARYVYDFSKRLGIAEVTPTKKMPVRTTDKAGKVRKFKNENDRRKFEVKEAVKRAVAEDLTAPGNKVAQRAAEILEADMSDFAYLTPEEIYGVVTGYPTAPEADTREELERRYDMIRRHMLALQRVGDMEKGVYPSKMTRGQDAPDVTLRQLSREVRDMMNNFTFPADAEDPRLVNAHRALVNRLQYAIEELQKAVDTSTPINEKTARAVEETPEIKELRKTLRDLRDAYEAMPSVEAIREVRELEKARRNANKRYHFWNKRLEDAKAGVFPESFKGTTEAEKDTEVASYKDKAEAARKEYWQIKKNSPQERLATLTEKATKAEERLASLEEALNKTPVENPSKPKEAFVPSTPEEEAAYARLQAAREAIANVRKAILAKWRDENAEAIYKVKEAERFQYLSEKAAKIEQKIKNRDFTKEPKRKPVTSGRIVIAEEKVRQGMRTIEENIQWEANAASGWTGKVKNAYNKSGNVYRAWKASYDLSNVFVQSARLFTAHPLIGGRLIKETFNNAWTDEKMAEFMSAMHADPQYEMAYADGLALDQQFDDYFGTGMGEAFFRGLAQKAKGSTPGSPRALGGMIAQGVVISQRVFDMYGRAMRFEAYKAIVNDPAHSNLTPIQRKAIANMVNIMGGVGNTKMYNHNFAALLSNLMWSSRLFTAQLQTVMGGGGLLWNAGLGPEGSRANMNLKWYETATPGAYKLYARSIAGNIVLSQMFAAIGMLLGDRQPWEDEETLFWKAFNFLFGRPVIGSKNFDFSGGLTTYVSLARRLIGGSHIAMSGRAVSDEGFAGRMKVLSNFFRGRLRPDIAFAINVAFGEDVAGEKFGPLSGVEGVVNMVGEGAIPITPLAMAETMGDLFKTHGWTGIAVGLIPSLASDMFGAAKSSAPRDPRYEIERHKSRMGQVNKALKAAQDSGDFTEYERLRDIYLFDVQVDEDISSLDQAGKKALKVADDPSYADDVRQQAKKDAEYMFATARDILRGQGK